MIKNKKRIIFIPLLVVVLLFVFSGCSLFSKNKEREINSPLYTLHYEGQTEYVTRGEMLAYISQYRSFLYYRPNIKAEEAFDQFADLLIKRKLMIMKAKSHFVGDEAKNKSAFDILSNDEKDYVIKIVNKQFEDSFQSYVKDIINDEKYNKQGDKEASEEKIKMVPKLDPRKPNPLNNDAIQYIENPSLEEADIEKKWLDVYSKDYHRSTITEPVGTEAYEFLFKTYESAYKKFMDQLEKNFNSYDKILKQNAETRLLNKYRKYLENNALSSITEEEINKKYDQVIKNSAKNEYKDITLADLAKKGESLANRNMKTVIPNTWDEDKNSGYDVIAVRSILFKFSEEQIRALKQYREKYAIGDPGSDYYSFREKLALTDDIVKDADGTISVQGGIPIYKSNEKFDPNSSIDAKNAPYIGELVGNEFKYKKFKYTDILAAIDEELSNVTSVVDSKYPNATAVEKVKLYNEAKINVFMKWINRVNDDPGMLGKEEKKDKKTKIADTYKVKIYDNATLYDSKYVKEYSVLARELVKNAGANYVGVCGGVAANTYDNVKVYVVNNISFIINDYGIQFIMLEARMRNGEASSNLKYYDSKDNEVSTLNSSVKYGVYDLSSPVTESGYATLKDYLKSEISREKANDIEVNEQKELAGKAKKDKSDVMFTNKKVKKDVMSEIQKLIDQIRRQRRKM